MLDTTTWKIKRKIALPGINMNNTHNMWSNRDQSIIFQTQWFDNKLTFINQFDGAMIDNVCIGDSPSHVMTLYDSISLTGRVVVTAKTGGSITIVDTSIDKVVALLPCDPGCHGVNFGAKAGGSYYAYVSSKFSNRLVVVDPDPNGDGNFADEKIAGTVAIADNTATTDDVVVSLAVLAVPNVFNGWVQNLPGKWQTELTSEQLDLAP